ncbi:hypothetical protein FKG94_03615 [Exilibacterium tricleocarpae]|uniref:DUF6249 domain-containing protein n=1 Tax=Exilibacterium tricleocarpae TaxID=2591008 RepID=A0A545U579_9GAMM|nr:DUF6249 domain-containing protein [Exilibacterium tricleocarpae]TQV84622.1 hypothetical protein FKG94_03615 [Exilibacterium tricleocarpae]
MQRLKTFLTTTTLYLLLALATAGQAAADGANNDPDNSETVTLRVMEKLQQRGLVDAQQVEAAREQARKTAASQPPESTADSAAALYAIAAEYRLEAILAAITVVALLSTPVLIVGLVSINQHRRRKLLHDNINKMIEKGRELPPELFDHLESRPRHRETGVKYMAVGLGTAISLAIIDDLALGSLGLIPLFLGLAHLLIWKLNQPPAGTAP